ncbi:MAG: LD-carboxypeptidase [Bacilli bacterium]|nr:LD-carboxypeptidase [Bacilli bacterium]
MKYPSFLKKNDLIGVPAPSAGAGDELKVNKYKHANKYFKDNGYKTLLSKNIYKCNKGRSADKKIRADEINEMFKNKDIDLILCAGGGEFLVEILPYIDFDLIKKNPKYICGFSDPTGLLYSITTLCDIATVYGNNFSSFGEEKFYQCHYDFLDIITGKKLTEESYKLYENESLKKVTGLEGLNLTEKVYWNTLNNKKVKFTGRIIGGCFDIIAELAGTKYDGIDKFNEKYKDDGIIWYFDNCELSKEETIRTLWKFNELGYFKYAKGVIFGRFGVETSYFEYDTKNCLKDSVLGDLNIPVIYDADISHKGPTLTIINGSIAHVECDKGKGKINFELE